MSLDSIGFTHENMLIFFKVVKEQIRSLDSNRIEYRSESYPSLRILNHKGYIYVCEQNQDMCVYEESIQIDGFKCSPVQGNSNKIFMEIQSSGGDSNIFTDEAFKKNMPNNVISFLLDCLKPGFLKGDLKEQVF